MRLPFFVCLDFCCLHPATDCRGELSLPFNSQAMFRAWVGAGGCIGVAVGPGEHGMRI